ncbi:hypothetical protein CAL12_13535 [Bordetella genomosp. 8]|uniref:Methyltransferase domain-containing protein n=1 Tax=Bordetella genomosp. 8 TaxID=1416806 RepID=A0A1W6YL58_9BORD|nr:class I SAM-dependent methyltransferase [Bordetella genomosp. 8]ARP81734.1 hypothetical protein CAL12_13535 [Bordetella genomosp. 8]
MNHFDALYRQSSDPWDVRTSWYEQRKRAVLLAALPRQRYGRILELGCGNGEMTRQLARRAGSVIAADGAETAVALCMECMVKDGLENVRGHVGRLPGDWPLQPGETCDLIVVSELAYYIPAHDMDDFLHRCAAALAPGGEWVMCHYTRDFDDRLQPTSELHARIDALGGLARVLHHEDERFLLDIWRKPEKDGR